MATVTLPIAADLLYPLVRVLVMPQGNWTAATQPWEVLPSPKRISGTGAVYFGVAHGYELDSVEHAALPEVGAAVFHFDFGEINAVDYDNTEDSTGDTTARNLTGYDVRIEMAPADDTAGEGFSPVWKTVFLGTVVSQEDDPFAGKPVASGKMGGRRTYRCADLIWRTNRWQMNRSATYVNGKEYRHAYGHPGYNYTLNGYYRRVIGNKDSTNAPATDPYGDLDTFNANYICHTWTGSGSATTWNDLQVVNHALVSSRAKGEPLLAVTGATDLLSNGIFVWSVNESESCFDFISRVLKRQRGRGLARLEWTEASATGKVTPTIKAYAQTEANITYTKPVSGTTGTFNGATANSSTIAIDLTGDHRVPDGGISISQNETAKIEYLESFGEQIEILVTLSPGDDTLAKRWGASEETAFEAIAPDKLWQRSFDRWRPVWQRYGLKPDWDFRVKDGNGGTAHTINWYCNDAGAITSTDLVSGGADTTYRGNPQPLTCRILSDLPIYEGYDYTTSSSTRYDGATDLLCPPRMPPLILANWGTDVYDDVTTSGVGIANDDFGVLVMCGRDQAGSDAGARFFGDTTKDSLKSVYDYTRMVLSVGLQLSHRVRVATGAAKPTGGGNYGPTDTPRRKSLYFQGIHLWLADYKAIWSFNYLTAVTYHRLPAFRAAAGGTSDTPGITRDDRDALAAMHALAWNWYSISHRTAQWELRDCGLLPSWTDSVAGSVNFPTVGKLVTSIICAGNTYGINSPITRCVYNAKRGTTTWFTDWADLDLV